MNIYEKLFRQTNLTDYRIGKTLGLGHQSIRHFKETKVVDFPRLIEMMVALNVDKLEYKQDDVYIEIDKRRKEN